MEIHFALFQILIDHWRILYMTGQLQLYHDVQQFVWIYSENR